MNIKGIYEAYSAVYDENIREEIIELDEDLSFIDDLSDNELTQIMEEILSEEEITLQECLDVFDAELLSEARRMSPKEMQARSARRKSEAAASEKSAKEARSRAAKKERSERRAERVQRVKSAANRAVQKAKTLGGGAVSAAAGGAAEAGRAVRGAASSAKKKVTGKLASAKEKIKGMVKSGRKAVAGGLRRAAAKVEPKETEKKTAPIGTSANPRVGQPAKERPALPAASSGKTMNKSDSRRTAAAAKLARAASGIGPSGTVQQGQPAGTFKSKRSREQARKREARLTASESFELLDLVVSDLIDGGYAQDIDSAYDLIENMDLNETYNLVESYINQETVDVYDFVLEHLIVEGYADTLEQAEVIMANMSEEWRNSIIG